MHNLISTLKNGILIKKQVIYKKFNKEDQELLNILWNEGLILGYKKLRNNNFDFNIIKIFLKYKKNNSVINSINIISKPSLRVYCSLEDLWKLKNVQGLIIISTDSGLKTIYECKNLNLGGQLIALIK